MGFFSKFENKMEDAIDDLGDKFFDAPISPVQIAKKAEKQMRRNKMLGAGKQYAPTLYTVLVNKNDDARLFGYYPTLAGETETYLKAKANEAGFVMDGDPLVRFIVDNDLKSGKFDVIAEAVASEIIAKLRVEENSRYSQYANQPQAQMPAQNNVAQNNVAAANFASPNNVSADSKPFADIGQSAVPTPAANVTPQSVPAPAPSVAPQQVPVPTPSPAPAPAPFVEPVQMPNPVPTPAVAAVEPTPSAAAAVNDPSEPSNINDNLSSAKTQMFSGNFDAHSQTTPTDNPAAATLTDDSSGRAYKLISGVNVIGRETTCNVVLPDANASRQHAQITFNNGSWFINDLGSTNGTFVNNQEITTRQINVGDVVTIGVTKLRFSIN